jgi:hypothetical protein
VTRIQIPIGLAEVAHQLEGYRPVFATADGNATSPSDRSIV